MTKIFASVFVQDSNSLLLQDSQITINSEPRPWPGWDMD